MISPSPIGLPPNRADNSAASRSSNHGIPQDESVLEELRARLNNPAYRHESNHRLALCIEGGGMRGVVTAGMALALEEAGAVDVFDEVFAASSGAFNAAYFLTNSVHRGIHIYTRAASHFIRVSRALVMHPLIDFDRLLRFVAEGQWSIPTIGFKAIHERLRIVVTSLRDGTPHCLADIATRDQLIAALEATSRMPGLADVGGRSWTPRYVDGSVTDPFGITCACQGTSTLILVLASRALKGERRANLLDRVVIQPALARLRQDLGRQYIRMKSSNCHRLTAAVSERQVPCFVVQPPSQVVATIESRTHALEHAANIGNATMQALLATCGRG